MAPWNTRTPRPPCRWDLGDTIGVRAGTYTGFHFGKLRGTAQAKILIVNHGGVVEITGSCSSCSSHLTDAVQARLSGTGQAGVNTASGSTTSPTGRCS